MTSGRAKKILGGMLIVLLGASCAQSPPRGGPVRVPSAVSGHQLYAEYPGPDEADQFRALGAKINEIQDELKKAHKQPQDERGFHAKATGCLKGTMQVLDERPSASRFGVFAEDGKTWPVWVRFSNAMGFPQADHLPDARGMAVKVMGVTTEKYGPKFMDDENTTQDFLMTNVPLGFGTNAEEFMAFAAANARGKAALLEFLGTHPKIAELLLTRVLTHIVKSAQTEQYWSESPYHLGPPGEAAKAIKFTATPCSENHSDPSATLDQKLALVGPKAKDVRQFFEDPNYLRTQLQNHASQAETCFILSVQFQKDPDKQPIEDGLVDWKESDTPFLPVAKIVLPPQEFASASQQIFCDDLSFNPWHALAEHRPLGNLNRARRVVYPSSVSVRNRSQKTEPTGNESF